MNRLTRITFRQWMTAYGKASAENDAQASAELFTEDAEYYVSPFEEPITGRDAIHAYWTRGAQTLEGKQSTYQLLSVEDNLGIARWQSSFAVKESGKRFSLDCLFVVEFNDEGHCRTFREWWHLRETALLQEL